MADDTPEQGHTHKGAEVAVEEGTVEPAGIETQGILEIRVLGHSTEAWEGGWLSQGKRLSYLRLQSTSVRWLKLCVCSERAAPTNWSTCGVPDRQQRR